MADDHGGRPEARGYHHGQLRESLIAAALALVRDAGLDRFSLRAVAARVGVSQAAPAHHFGSARGLLTELAVVGYGMMRDDLLASDPGPVCARLRLRACAGAYVGFAMRESGLYQLMFRRDLIDRENPAYTAAANGAIGLLTDAMAADSGCSMAPNSTLADRAPLLEAFAMVHGLAMLAIERKFDAILPEADRSDFCGRVVPVILNARWPL